MKKIYILVIFTISLFFFSFSSVSAAVTVYNYTFTDDDFSYINDEFINFRTKVLDYINNSDNYDYYVISYDLTNNRYIVNIFNSKELPSIREFRENGKGYFIFKYMSSYTTYVLQDNNFVFDSTSSGFSKYVILNSTITYYNLLDCNFDVFPNQGFNTYTNLVLNYNDKSYIFDEEKRVLSLYDLYVEFKVGEKFDPHEEEKNVLLNFYNLVIEKIGFLVNMFTGNYVYLSVFVVLILIIILEIVRGLL